MRACSSSSPRSTSCPLRCWPGAGSRSSRALRGCAAAAGGCEERAHPPHLSSDRRGRGGSPRRTRTCRTSRSVPRRRPHPRGLRAERGRLLLSADYSQVELRIVAHYSGDESLIEAFARDEDVHRRTAAEVHGIGPAEVSDDHRAHAKRSTSGSSMALPRSASRTSSASPSRAQATIDRYFERYPACGASSTRRWSRRARGASSGPCSGGAVTCPTSPRAIGRCARRRAHGREQRHPVHRRDLSRRRWSTSPRRCAAGRRPA